MPGKRRYRDAVGVDLILVLCIVCATVFGTWFLFPGDSVVRPILAVVFVLFVPGWTLMAALFPETRAESVDDPNDCTRSTTGIERIVYSVVLSFVVSGLVGITLNFTEYGVRRLPVITGIVGITLLLVGIAVFRRLNVPTERRFAPSLTAARSRVGTSDRSAGSGVSFATTLAVAFAVLVVVSSITFAVAVRDDGERFTELYVLSENDQGELIAAGQEMSFTEGETRTLTVGIENREDKPIDYTLITEVQRISPSNGSVMETQQVDRSTYSVGEGEAVRFRSQVPLNVTGERVRLVYFLYAGDPPLDPTVVNAYREVHLWMDIESDTPTNALLSRGQR